MRLQLTIGEMLGQPGSGGGARVAGDIGRRTRRDDAPALRTAAGAHVDEVIADGQQVQIMVDGDHCSPGVQQPVEHRYEGGDVERMQSG